MIGILLMSHGKMAEGVLDSCTLFLGDDIPAITALCLLPEDNPEAFDARIEEAVAKLDDGSGVIGVCDILGGTPSNRSVNAIVTGQHMNVVTGMNLPMVIDLLMKRNAAASIDEIDLNSTIDSAKEGIVSLRDVIKK